VQASSPDRFPELLDRLVDHAGEVHRNIATIRESQDLLDDLSADPRERAFGEAAAERPSPLPDPRSPVILRPFEYGMGVPGATSRPVSRFSDSTRFGVWYGSETLETTVHETVHHFRRRIEAMRAPIDEVVVAERRVFRVRLAGLLVDLRGKETKFPGLVDRASYAFTHRVGAYLHGQGQNGLLVRSARCEGTNVAVFDPRVLSDPRHHCYLTYRWRPGDAAVRVERTPGRRWMDVRAAADGAEAAGAGPVSAARRSPAA